MSDLAKLLREAADRIEDYDGGDDICRAVEFVAELRSTAAEIEAQEPVHIVLDNSGEDWEEFVEVETTAGKSVRIYRHPPAVPEGWKLVPVEPAPERYGCHIEVKRGKRVEADCVLNYSSPEDCRHCIKQKITKREDCKYWRPWPAAPEQGGGE